MYPTTTASTKWTDSEIICRKGDGHGNFRYQLGVPRWEGQGQYPEAIDSNLLFTLTLTVGRRMFAHLSHFLGPTNILRYHIDRHPGSLQRPDHRCSKETRLPCELGLSYHIQQLMRTVRCSSFPYWPIQWPTYKSWGKPSPWNSTSTSPQPTKIPHI